MSELSQRVGVPIPTIKYYLREGLLPAGQVTGRNQAAYDEDHLRRLRLVRALLEVGGLSVAATREVLAALDDPAVSQHDLLGAAQSGLAGQARADRSTVDWQRARAEASTRVAGFGWRVSPAAPDLDRLADAICALRALGWEDLLLPLDSYAAVAGQLAQQECAAVTAVTERSAVVEGMVIGTILGEVLLTSLRRLAHEHFSGQYQP